MEEPEKEGKVRDAQRSHASVTARFDRLFRVSTSLSGSLRAGR